MYQNTILGIIIGLTLAGVPCFFYLRALKRIVKGEREFTKSPFSEKLLRPPGESLRGKIDGIRNDLGEQFYSLAAYIAAPGAFCMLISQLSLLSVIILSSLVFIICALLARRPWKKIKALRNDLINYRLGFDGERYVAAELAPLAAKGYHIFHDFIFDMVPGGDETNFNIDHIVVGPEGVFAIETKAKRKLKKTSVNELTPYEIAIEGTCVEDTTLRFSDGSTDNKPIAQAIRQAESLQRWLSKSGITLEVRPLVVFPGWMVKSKQWKKLGVQSAKNIASRLPDLGKGRRLSTQEVQQIAARLEDKCRNIEGAK